MTVSDNRVFTWKFKQLVWLLFGMLEALIGLRVVLRLIAANPQNPFARLVYGLSGLFVWPFLGLTRTPSANGAVLEISSLIAMFVYALVGWVIVQLVWILIDRPRSTTVVTRNTTVVEQSRPSQPQNQPRI